MAMAAEAGSSCASPDAVAIRGFGSGRGTLIESSERASAIANVVETAARAAGDGADANLRSRPFGKTGAVFPEIHA